MINSLDSFRIASKFDKHVFDVPGIATSLFDVFPSFCSIFIAKIGDFLRTGRFLFSRRIFWRIVS